MPDNPDVAFAEEHQPEPVDFDALMGTKDESAREAFGVSDKVGDMFDLITGEAEPEVEAEEPVAEAEEAEEEAVAEAEEVEEEAEEEVVTEAEEEPVAEETETEEEPPAQVDLTALSSALGHHLTDVSEAAEQVETLHQRVQDMSAVQDLLDTAPEFLRALADGGTLAEAAAQIPGVALNAPDKLDDPDGYVEWKLSQEKAQSQKAQLRQRQEQQQQAVQRAQQQAQRALSAFGEKVQADGLTFDAEAEAQAIRSLTSIGEDGKIDPAVFPAIYYGRRYDDIARQVSAATEAAQSGQMDAIKEQEGDFPLVKVVKSALRDAYTNGARAVKDRSQRVQTPPNLTGKASGAQPEQEIPDDIRMLAETVRGGNDWFETLKED